MTGPTGSGKTVSLYTGLNILNKPEINISTAEDPVEINLSGINQVQVQPKIGFGFAEALRSFLRQDPDVVMVGEIRDLDTAEIAIKASQTGHLCSLLCIPTLQLKPSFAYQTWAWKVLTSPLHLA